MKGKINWTIHFQVIFFTIFKQDFILAVHFRKFIVNKTDLCYHPPFIHSFKGLNNWKVEEDNIF